MIGLRISLSAVTAFGWLRLPMEPCRRPPASAEGKG